MNLQTLIDAGIPGDLPIVIAPDAMKEVDRVVEELGLTGRGVAVYEDDTFRAVHPKPKVFRSILFDNEQLYCNELSLHYLRKQCVEEGAWLIGIGGEAVLSITKLVAAEAHMPWIAVPTCAFGLGMASRMADEGTAMGYRRAVGAAPSAIVADTSLMAQAEESVTLGAVRELIDRAGTLARNRAQALAAGYPWNQEAYDCQQQAIAKALRVCNHGLRRGAPEAYALLCEALITCGLAENGMDLCAGYPSRLNFLNERTLREAADHE